MSSRRKAMLLLATSYKWLPYSYEYLLNSLVPTTIDNKNVKNKAKIIKLYGNGCVVNQLISPAIATQTLNGLTLTNNDDGSLTISGTATADTNFYIGGATIQANHVYLLFGCASGGSSSTYALYCTGNMEDIGLGKIYKFTSAQTPSLRITIKNGTTINNLVFKPQLIDLSHSYGLGNEPTLLTDNRIQAILNRGSISYNTGEYVGTDISEITSKDSNNVSLATIPFKAQLNGAINSHDTLEITSSAYVFEKNIDRVDLGTLNYGYNSSSLFFQALNFSGFKTFSWNETANILCGNYTTATSDDVELGTKGDLVIGLSSSLKIRDTQYTNATDFKTAMSGVYLYYQLATPQTISIPRKHLGIVDLGTLNWGSSANYTNVVETTSSFSSAKKPTSNSTQANVYCSKYITKFYYSGGTGVVSTSLSIGISASGYIYINDNSLFGLTNAEIQAKLYGTYLFYETQDEVDDIVDKIGIEAGGSLSANEFSYVENNLGVPLNDGGYPAGSSSYSITSSSVSELSATVNNTDCNLVNYRYSSSYGRIEPIIGHKYLFAFDLKYSKTLSELFYEGYGFGGVAPIDLGAYNVANTWQNISTIMTCSSVLTYFKIFLNRNGVNTNVAVGDTFSIRNLLICDLTVAFGSGNEPTTITDKEIQYLINKGYIAYNPDGTLVSVPPLALLNLDTKMKCK